MVISHLLNLPSKHGPYAGIFKNLQQRCFSIHEFQAMNLLKSFGIPIPQGQVANTPEEAYKIALNLKRNDFVVKAQVLAGGRGKGNFEGGLVGGVRTASSPEEVQEIAGKMLGKLLYTKQTGTSGRPCNHVYVVERLFPRKEYYMAILLDRNTNGLTLMGSSQGGMDIETIAAQNPNSIIHYSLPLDNVNESELKKFATDINISPKNISSVSQMIKKMILLFKQKDAVLLEINPLVETNDGNVICLDAKINFDENADFRQQEIFSQRDPTQEDPREVKANQHKLSYIGLDGHIGCLVNGAGLAMATMDIIKLHGGEPANFLDVGGSASSEQVGQALKILREDPSVKVIMINIFGGIMRCDIIAEGIVNAVRGDENHTPIVVRLLGTNADVAKELINKSALNIFMCDNLEEAANKAVILSKIMDLSSKADIKIKIQTK